MDLRYRPVTLLLAAGAAALAGCGHSSSGAASTTGSAGGASANNAAPSAPATPAVIDVATIPGLGPVLVNGKGATLYAFLPDAHTHVSCTGSCATVWPPLMVAPGTMPKAGPGVAPNLIGSDRSPAGGMVATYNGWPLHTYATDPANGYAMGQNINNNGGKWYVVAPTGTLVMKPNPASASTQ